MDDRDSRLSPPIQIKGRRGSISMDDQKQGKVKAEEIERQRKKK